MAVFILQTYQKLVVLLLLFYLLLEESTVVGNDYLLWAIRFTSGTSRRCRSEQQHHPQQKKHHQKYLSEDVASVQPRRSEVMEKEKYRVESTVVGNDYVLWAIRFTSGTSRRSRSEQQQHPQQKKHHQKYLSEDVASVQPRRSEEMEKEKYIIECNEKRSTAIKIVGAKMLQGYTLKESQCNDCVMPLMEYPAGALQCVMFPMLAKKAAKKHKKALKKEKKLAEPQQQGRKQMSSQSALIAPQLKDQKMDTAKMVIQNKEKKEGAPNHSCIMASNLEEMSPSRLGNAQDSFVVPEKLLPTTLYDHNSNKWQMENNVVPPSPEHVQDYSYVSAKETNEPSLFCSNPESSRSATLEKKSSDLLQRSPTKRKKRIKYQWAASLPGSLRERKSDSNNGKNEGSPIPSCIIATKRKKIYPSRSGISQVPFVTPEKLLPSTLDYVNTNIWPMEFNVVPPSPEHVNDFSYVCAKEIKEPSPFCSNPESSRSATIEQKLSDNSTNSSTKKRKRKKYHSIWAASLPIELRKRKGNSNVSLKCPLPKKRKRTMYHSIWAASLPKELKKTYEPI